MRRILVTGANKGIGLAIVTAILKQHNDTAVLLGSRDAERGEAAVQGLLAAHPDWSERLELLTLDVADGNSVTQAAAQVAERFGSDPAPLYGVVNNAGLVGEKDLAAVLNINVVGIHRVCSAFLPLLTPGQGRIVNITSAAGPSYVATCDAERQRFFLDPNITWEALEAFMQDCIRRNDVSDVYGLSKACANSYTLRLARENPQLQINACTPGFIETDATRAFATSQNKTPAEMGMKPPSEGAVSALHLLFADLEGQGHYYGSDAQRSPLDRYRAPGSAPYTGD
ncbi:MAG: SDR family NAD(P)-dependent oxidoreductase [Candidatus Sericytochromatia bacterium]